VVLLERVLNTNNVAASRGDSASLGKVRGLGDRNAGGTGQI
jgi:hypothetical protein